MDFDIPFDDPYVLTCIKSIGLRSAVRINRFEFLVIQMHLTLHDAYRLRENKVFGVALGDQLELL